MGPAYFQNAFALSSLYGMLLKAEPDMLWEMAQGMLHLSLAGHMGLAALMRSEGRLESELWAVLPKNNKIFSEAWLNEDALVKWMERQPSKRAWLGFLVVDELSKLPVGSDVAQEHWRDDILLNTSFASIWRTSSVLNDEERLAFCGQHVLECMGEPNSSLVMPEVSCPTW